MRKAKAVDLSVFSQPTAVAQTDPAVIESLFGAGGGPTDAQQRSIVRIQSQFRGKQSRKAARGKAIISRITLLMANA